MKTSEIAIVYYPKGNNGKKQRHKNYNVIHFSQLLVQAGVISLLRQHNQIPNIEHNELR